MLGRSSNPVTDISMIGEHTLQGPVTLKPGAGISWCPSGSPGAVVGAGIGLKPSSVEWRVGM
jgi:hypothetical protein